MAISIENLQWWKAKEIPFIETDWRSIKLYCDEKENPFEWDRCVYVIRIAPPFCISYGDKLLSPLLYVGSGSISQRWSDHRGWLSDLGHSIPGGRYEIWVCKARRQRNSSFYEHIEACILSYFNEKTGFLPLRNLKIQTNTGNYIIDDELVDEFVKPDRRYLWSIVPLKGNFKNFYVRGQVNLVNK